MRLVVEIERIGDELFQIDLRRALEPAALASAPIVSTASLAALAARMTTPAFSSSALATLAPSTLTRAAALARTTFAPAAFAGTTAFARTTAFANSSARALAFSLATALTNAFFRAGLFRSWFFDRGLHGHAFGARFLLLLFICHSCDPLGVHANADAGTPRRAPTLYRSVDNLAHSSATRPDGRNFKLAGFFPTRSAIKLARAF